MTDRIEGQVAQILNARELVVNRGISHGVQVGMRFAVLGSSGAGIQDPETGEELGLVQWAKTVVKVVRLHERVSVARTFRTTRTGGGLSVGAFGASFGTTRTLVEKLRTDETALQDELDREELYVKIGDPVVQVIGDEYDIEDS